MDSKSIELIIVSILIGIYFLFCGKKLLIKDLHYSPKVIFWYIVLIIFLGTNYLVLDNSVRLITTYVGVLFVYKTLYCKNITKCAIATIISYFMLIVGEIVFTIALTIMNELGMIENMSIFIGSAIANFFICCVGFCCFMIFKSMAIRILTKIKNENKWTLIITFMIVIAGMGALFFKMTLTQWNLDAEFILNMIIIMAVLYISGVIIKQHLDKTKINDEYEEYIKYSKGSEKLVEQYSISQHENKNELIIIKSMVHKNNKKLLEYLDEIISSKDNIDNSWIKYLRYIPFGGLKGILHNKISIMKDKEINVFINVSKDIGMSLLKDLTMKENVQLSKIVGVFLDNSSEAAINSKQKEVSICVYKEKRNVVFEISNSYEESTNINLNKIGYAGHSTKGKNRGYGLALVKSLIEDNNLFYNETKIHDGYFVQKLVISKDQK